MKKKKKRKNVPKLQIEGVFFETFRVDSPIHIPNVRIRIWLKNLKWSEEMDIDTYEKWYEYLELIDIMAGECKGLYGFDDRRTKVHSELSEYYKWFYGDKFIQERFDNVCHNLDKVISIHIPLDPTDHIKPNARALDNSMMVGALKHYVIGRTGKLPEIL